MNKLTFASLNTYGGVFNIYDLTRRYKNIGYYFNCSKVDIIHFQEIFTYYHLFLLRQLLKSYLYCVYTKSSFGPKGGLVTFSRLPIQKINYFSYLRKHVPYFSRSLIEILTQRGILITTLINHQLTLFNTHLTAVLNHNWSVSSKYYLELTAEINQFHQLIKKPNQAKSILISGDFNIAKKSQLYQQLTILPGLFDINKTDPKPTRHLEYALPGQKVNCVDYIFIFDLKKTCKITNPCRLFENKLKLDGKKTAYVSDHIGLSVEIDLPG